MITDLATILGAIAAIVAIAAAAIKVGAWVQSKRQAKAARAERAEPPYPVRLICRDATDFHPSSGYHEALYFEVFNESDVPVTVRAFGLDLTMAGQEEWHRYEHARQTPPHKFPVRLAANDGLDGYIDMENLGEELYADGDDGSVLQSRAYVDVVGYGEKTIEVPKR